MFFCNTTFQLIFLKFINELYLIILLSIVLYYLVKIYLSKNYLLQTTVGFILIITNHAFLFNSGIEGYSTTLCFNHLYLKQYTIECALRIYLFTALYINFFAPLWTKFFVKSQLIILLNLLFCLQILFLTNSMLTFIFIFEVLSLLLIFQLLFHIQLINKRKVVNFAAIFFYNFWITFFTSIGLFIVVILMWTNLHTLELNFIECCYSLVFYTNWYTSALILLTIMSFILFFFIKIGFIPFFFWKFTVFYYFKFHYLTFYFLFFLFPLILFFLHYIIFFLPVFIEHSYSAFILWIISALILFKNFLYFEQTWTSFLINSTGLLLLLLLLPFIIV